MKKQDVVIPPTLLSNLWMAYMLCGFAAGFVWIIWIVNPEITWRSLPVILLAPAFVIASAWNTWKTLRTIRRYRREVVRAMSGDKGSE